VLQSETESQIEILESQNFEILESHIENLSNKKTIVFLLS